MEEREPKSKDWRDEPRQIEGVDTSDARALPAPAEVESEASKKPESETTRRIIDQFLANGLIAKIEVPGTRPRIWINPSFYALDYDTKNTFAKVVFVHYADSNPKLYAVLLIDNLSGREVGILERGSNLELYR